VLCILRTIIYIIWCSDYSKVGTENHFHFHFYFYFYFYFSRGYSLLPDAETSFAWNLKLTVLGFSLFHQFSVSFDVDNFRISSLLASG
jgi:hypothetical protein